MIKQLAWNTFKETGDIMAVVNASAEITAKQNILKYLEAPPEVTEEQRIALVQQDDLLDTVYRRMEEGTAFASQAIASEILVKLAEELARLGSRDRKRRRELFLKIDEIYSECPSEDAEYLAFMPFWVERKSHRFPAAI